MPINVFLLIAQKPWYNAYELMPRLFSLTWLGDQQLGGILMLVGMIAIYGTMAIKAFWSFEGAHWGE